MTRIIVNFQSSIKMLINKEPSDRGSAAGEGPPAASPLPAAPPEEEPLSRRRNRNRKLRKNKPQKSKSD